MCKRYAWPVCLTLPLEIASSGVLIYYLGPVFLVVGKGMCDLGLALTNPYIYNQIKHFHDTSPQRFAIAEHEFGLELTIVAAIVLYFAIRDSPSSGEVNAHYSDVEASAWILRPDTNVVGELITRGLIQNDDLVPARARFYLGVRLGAIQSRISSITLAIDQWKDYHDMCGSVNLAKHRADWKKKLELATLIATTLKAAIAAIDATTSTERMYQMDMDLRARSTNGMTNTACRSEKKN